MLDRYLIPETLIFLGYRSRIVKMFIAFFFLDVNLKKSLMNEVTQARNLITLCSNSHGDLI